ncbi:MAG: hypothetical protein KatS3mg031_1431 [Chitinophagales bacterium]|nr:MAG: hypothetical protein KatS3mg031_1431 [Chitinophagales bacterium]
MSPYKINLINSLVFISCGIFGFASHYLKLGEYQQEALIPLVLGLLLLVMTPGLRAGNVVIRKLVSFLTLLFGIIVLYLLIKSVGTDQSSARKMIVLTLIALSCFASFGVYLSSWIAEKKKN